MMDLDEFPGEALVRVYLAGELREAKRVESVLTEWGIDYTVEVERYRKQLLGFFPCVYTGAGFFVRPAEAALARSSLLEAGLRAGIQDNEEG
jgi:hypothetical protein